MSKNTHDWRTDTIFNEVVDWCGCHFLFNHEFRDDERQKISDMIYERNPEVLRTDATLPSPRRHLLQYMIYDILLELGYRESDM